MDHRSLWRHPEAESRRILGLNAAELYRFDTAALAPVVDRIGPTPKQVSGEAPWTPSGQPFSPAGATS